MAPGDVESYPLAGSLGARLFEESEEERESRCEPVEPDLSVRAAEELQDFPLSDLRDFLEVQRDLIELFPRKDRGERGFRKVPSGRRFGTFDHFDPEEHLFINTYVAPFADRASVLHLLFVEEPGEPLGERLVELGFPVPIEEPTVLIGRPELDEGALLLYVPGPEGLAELVYRIRTREGEATVAVSAVQPPQPRFDDLVQAYRETFDWEGALVFEDVSALERDDGELHPRGSKVHRSL